MSKEYTEEVKKSKREETKAKANQGRKSNQKEKKTTTKQRM